MKSSLPKVLHPICGRPMIQYSLDLARLLKPKKAYVVLGHKIEEVRKHVGADFRIIRQRQLEGTSDAVRQVLPYIRSKVGDILILYADNPLVTHGTLVSLLKLHRNASSECTLLTACVEEPSSYGRIIRGPDNNIISIVEEKEAGEQERRINEVNTGILVFSKRALSEAILKVRADNSKGEFYLTDVVRILADKGYRINSLFCPPEEALGVNSQETLSIANRVIQRRILQGYMDRGVRIISSEHTYINYGVKIGRDCVIYPFTVIENNVTIGNNCSVGPFCHLRESVSIKDNTSVGNFAELVRTKVGKNTLIKHFSYLGDADIGSNVNIGAGSVIANFDGRRKNHTKIGDGAFIGSDSVLVAPVKVGKGALTGAGCVVTKNKNVPDNTVVAGVPARIIRKRSRR